MFLTNQLFPFFSCFRPFFSYFFFQIGYALEADGKSCILRPSEHLGERVEEREKEREGKGERKRERENK